MIDYSQGKIYKIVCNKTGKVYIGSTCLKYLSQRLQGHKKNFQEWKDNKFSYISSFDVMANEDYDIILVEDYPCNSKNALRIREQHYIKTLNCVNMKRAYRTYEEYLEQNRESYDKHREYHLERVSKYCKDNAERISERRRKRYELNKEYQEKCKERSRVFSNTHKEQISKKRREHIVKCDICNKEMRKDGLPHHIDIVHKKLKDKCPDCGKEVSKGSLSRHMKSVHKPSNEP